MRRREGSRQCLREEGAWLRRVRRVAVCEGCIWLWGHRDHTTRCHARRWAVALCSAFLATELGGVCGCICTGVLRDSSPRRPMATWSSRLTACFATV